MFIKEDNGKLLLVDTDSNNVIKKLEPGLYNLDVKIIESLFGKMKKTYVSENTTFKKGFIATAGVFSDVVNFVDDFFSKEGKEVREAMSLQSRFGMLFKGEPGTGKTYLACQIAQQLIEKEDAICFLCSEFANINFTEVIDNVRRNNDPNQLVVFILDEFEKDYNNCKQNDILGFLDGTNSRNGVITLCTANTLDNLPETLLSRPGRFEKVLDFKITDPRILYNIVSFLIPEKYKKVLSVEDILSLVITDKKITIDKLKSIVRDSLMALLRGRNLHEIHNGIKNNIIYKEKEEEGGLNLFTLSASTKIPVETALEFLQKLYWDEKKSIPINKFCKQLNIKFKQQNIKTLSNKDKPITESKSLLSLNTKFMKEEAVDTKIIDITENEEVLNPEFTEEEINEVLTEINL